MASLHVSISAEPIAYLGDFAITNSMLTGSIVSLLLILFALYYSAKPTHPKQISRLQSFIELIIEGIFNLTKDIAGETKARVFFPLIATAIIFILFNNWIGLLPGVGTVGLNYEPEPASLHAGIPSVYAQDPATPAAFQEFPQDVAPLVVEEADQTSDENQHPQVPDEVVPDSQHESSQDEHASVFVPLFRASTADLNTTIALALISVGMTQYYGVAYLGLSYFTKFLNFKQGPIFTFVGLLEIISELAKVISFAFRLFGNIFAGEVLLAVIAYLLPLIAPVPFLGLEIFVGFIQALVFAMLTLVFINMATVGHEDH